ncbi:MAG: sulfotransferase family protein [Egibacteraceae bacterium]
MKRQHGLDPLFIVGAPRSGTSLLYKALCLHPATGYISNWVRRFPGIPQLAALNRMARRCPGMQRAVWFGKDSNAYVYASPRSWLARAFPMPVEGEPVYSRCGIAQPSGAHVLRSAFSAIQRYGGGDCMVSKRIANNQRIGLLREAFGQARFVEIIRDGRAVAYSLSKVDWWPSSVVWWYGGSPLRWRQEGGDPWELCARDWVEEVRAVEDGLAAVPAASVLRVRYEHLVRDLVPVLTELARFAGLPADHRWCQRLEQLQRPVAAESWRHRLAPGDLATIERIQAPTLRRRGYDVS